MQIRPAAELSYAHELEALRAADTYEKPAGWQLSPRLVVDYIMGGQVADLDIEPKYIGSRRLIEVAVATLATDRALLLSGLPGTAKTWVSEHLAAAISGDSTLLVQGTSGLVEDAIRYGWNYAMLIAQGPSRQALLPSPVLHAMEGGKIARIEELSRINADVQDALITILSEKIIPIPELNTALPAQRGFNLIATANDRDRGVQEMSSALRRRFNTLIMPLPATLEEEIGIVQFRVDRIGRALALPSGLNPGEKIEQLVIVFRELREGMTIDRQTKLKSPVSTLSTAEAISVMIQCISLGGYFGDNRIGEQDLAAALTGAIVKDESQDLLVWKEYLEKIMRRRSDWKQLYEACQEMIRLY